MASEHEGKPFHLLATHCQRNPRDDVVAYIRSNGLGEDTPNLTVSSFGGHPGVKGNGHVPYYMVFDHTGRLRHHHMGGAYHGGDGLGQVEWVKKLLDETPAIWLGEEPFEHIADLARRVESRKGLGLVAQNLEAERESAEGERGEEIERLYGALVTWRDRRLATADRFLASTPDEVVGHLKELSKELGGSVLGEPVAARLSELDGSKELEAAIALQKTLEKTQRKIAKLKVPKEAKRRGLKSFDLDDKACREAHAKTLGRSAKKLRKAIEGQEDLPIAGTVLEYVKRLDG